MYTSSGRILNFYLLISLSFRENEEIVYEILLPINWKGPILKFQIILIIFFHVDMSNILKYVEKNFSWMMRRVNVYFWIMYEMMDNKWKCLVSRRNQLQSVLHINGCHLIIRVKVIIAKLSSFRLVDKLRFK